MSGKIAKPRTSIPVDEILPSWGVLVFESHHGGDFYMTPRQHPFVKVLYLLAGSGAVVEQNSRIDCRAGDVVVISAGRRHWIEDDPAHPLSLYALCVSPQVWAMDPDLTRHMPTGLAARKGRIADRVRVALRRLLYEQISGQGGRIGCAAAMCGQSLELLAMLARTAAAAATSTPVSMSDKNESLVKVRAYVRELDRRFYEATTIDEAAAELGVGRRSFTQLFRQLTGRTWLHYVQQRRIEHARKLLRSTDRTVLAIAFECGYGDLSTFYRAFTSAEGCSPNAWRSRKRK